MKKITALFLPAACMAAALLTTACSKQQKTETKTEEAPMAVIFETDMGNDVDDALALTMLYNYVDQGKVDLLGVMLNKEGAASADFIDILNTYYGHPDIPIGVITDGAPCDDAVNYAKAVAEMKDSVGNPAFARTLPSPEGLPQAVTLYRKILAAQPDSSVTIVSVGFSTNLARLLLTGADEYSALSGRDLVARKVKLVSMMGGSATDSAYTEYNIMKDAAAARRFLAEWPGKIVMSPFEVGKQVLYPATAIEEGLTSGKGLNPVEEAYKSYLKMPYDRPSWDLTSVLYAVEAPAQLKVSGQQFVAVTDKGATLFTPDETAGRYYLSLDSADVKAVTDRLVELTRFDPKSAK